jgi:Zn-finger nucleic acid-binding protein
VNGYKTLMAVMLICPKCSADTELRGTLDAYYLTWCPACERLWRFELWTLMNAHDPERKMPWLTSR